MEHSRLQLHKAVQPVLKKMEQQDGGERQVMVVVRLPVSRAVSDLEENTAQNVPKTYQISSPNVKTK